MKLSDVNDRGDRGDRGALLAHIQNEQHSWPKKLLYHNTIASHVLRLWDTVGVGLDILYMC